MLLMVEKGIRGGIFHSIYRYAKANNNLQGIKFCEYLILQFRNFFVKLQNQVPWRNDASI